MKDRTTVKLKVLGAVALAGCLAFPAKAQLTSAVDGATPPVLAAGRAAGSYPLSGFESVNLFGGGLSFHLPLANVAGAGETAAPVFLTLDKRWVMMYDESNGYYSYYPLPVDSFSTWLQDYSPGKLSIRVQGRQLFTGCTEGTAFLFKETVIRFTFRDGDGTEHEFVDSLTGGSVFSHAGIERGSMFPNEYTCLPDTTSRGRVWVTRDGSFMTLVLESNVIDHGTAPSAASDPSVTAVLTGYLYKKDGTRIRIENGLVKTIRDRNGRFTTYTYGNNRLSSITDAMGRIISITYGNAGAAAGETYDRITYPGTGGTTRSVDVYYCALEPASASNCTNYTGPTAQTYSQLFGVGSSVTKYNPGVVSFVKLPDGRRYEFSYNAYAELTKVKLPTGGAIEYEHSGGGSGGLSTIGYNSPGGTLQVYRRVSRRRTIREDGTVATWTNYIATYGTGCPAEVPAYPFCTKVIEENRDGAGAVVLAATRHDYYGDATNPESFYYHGYYVDYRNGKERVTEQVKLQPPVNSATNPAGRQVTQTWEQRACVAGEVCPTAIGQYPGSPVDPRVKRSTTTLDSNQSSLVDLAFDQFNNVTSQKEYGFNGTVLRETVTSYVTSNTVNGEVLDYVTIPAAAPVVHIRNLPAWRKVYEGAVAGGVVAAQTDYSYDKRALDTSGATSLDLTVPAARGNVTTEARWLGGSTSLEVVRQYYDSGALHWVQDPRLNTTIYTYGCNGVTLATATNALLQVTTVTADCNTGQPTMIVDPNLTIETRSYNDPLDRATDSWTGGYLKTQFSYLDASRTVETRRDVTTPGDGAAKVESVYDGLGRVKESRQYLPNNIVSKVRTTYDALGRVWQVSNPFEGAEPTDWTTTLYDSLSRPAMSVTAPDGSATTTSYAGAVVTVTDPAGAKRVLTHDAAGRLASVDEYKDAGTSYSTAYAYNALDLLTGVTQGTQTRSFTYDRVGRLITATNPESGTICYGTLDGQGACVGSYDGNGNLLNRTETRALAAPAVRVVTSMEYDALNRITKKSYSDGTPEVTYVYDTDQVIGGVSGESKPKGRLVKVSNSVSTTLYRFDGLGRPLASEQSTTGQSKLVFQYGHQPAGMASMKYPSGRVVNWSYDGAGRPSGVQGGVGVTDYVTGIQYSVFGGMSQLALGNTLVEKWSYSDKRGQVRRIALGTAASDASVGEWLFSHCAGQAGTGECTSNNGNVRSQTINPLGKTQSYGYDWMNRLTVMVEQTGIVAVPACTGAPGEPPCPCTGAAGDPPCRVYDHDQYGNMWVPVWTLFAPDGFTAVGQSNYSNGKNQLTIQNSTFDEAGNLKTIGGQTYSYDGENRVKASTSGSSAVYEYDGEGRRVKKGAVVFAYDAQGRLAAEYGGTLTGAGGRRYVTGDHLGSTRVVTDGGGAVVSGQRHDYLPFGESLLAGVNGRTAAAQYGTTENLSELAKLFTGKERDSETGLDYFGARYFSGAQGRFTSPDEPFADQYESDPQSWNLYSYGRNNPLRHIDPTGRKCVKTDSGSMADDGTGGGCEAAGVDPSGKIKSQKVEVRDTAPPSPELLALALGMQRAGPVVNAAAVGTAVVMTGGFAGMGYGAIAGGAGLQQLGVAAGPAAYSLLPELGRKLDYLFGLAKGSVHNLQRSTSMLSELQRVGLNDSAQARTYVQAHLGRVLNDASSIVSQTGGRTVRESFLMGPTGGVKLETVWEGTKLITMKVLGGGR